MAEYEREQEKGNGLVGSLNDVHHVIGVMSGKGGVGKSTVSCLLASALARNGNKVGILDADITGPSVAKAFGIPRGKCGASEFGIVPPETPGGIKVMSINLFLPHEDDPVIWRGPLIGGAVKQFWEETFWGEIDYLVLDLPPGTGDVALTVMQSLPVDGLVVVSSPQELSLMVVRKAIKMAEKLNVPMIGLLENMALVTCPHCGQDFRLFGESRGREIAEKTGLKYLGSLPWDANLTLAMDNGDIERYSAALAGTVIGDIANLVESKSNM